jgi:hypothetical protein
LERLQYMGNDFLMQNKYKWPRFRSSSPQIYSLADESEFHAVSIVCAARSRINASIWAHLLSGRRAPARPRMNTAPDEKCEKSFSDNNTRERGREFYRFGGVLSLSV